METVVEPSVEEPSIIDQIRKEEPTTITDKLSPFELDELKADLLRRGIPAHEIDTIMGQAKILSRELVDELIKSLDNLEK